MTSEIYIILSLRNLTYKHQNKILPQEDGPRTKTTSTNAIEQYIQGTALGVKKSQNILFPFFTVLLFMRCLKIIIFSERILASQRYFECHEGAEGT